MEDRWRIGWLGFDCESVLTLRREIGVGGSRNGMTKVRCADQLVYTCGCSCLVIRLVAVVSRRGSWRQDETEQPAWKYFQLYNKLYLQITATVS